MSGWRPDRIALAAIRDDQIPELVRRCTWCGGVGEYEQTYTAGCGMGHYQTIGPCERCGGSYGTRGYGFVFVNTGMAVGPSVLAQLEMIGHRNINPTERRQG